MIAGSASVAAVPMNRPAHPRICASSSKMNRARRVHVSSVVSRKVLTASSPNVVATSLGRPNTDMNCPKPCENVATGDWLAGGFWVRIITAPRATTASTPSVNMPP